MCKTRRIFAHSKFNTVLMFWEKLTAPTNALPLTISTICSAISWPQRAWASFVLAPRCGQLITLGWLTRVQSLGGS